MGRRLTPTLGVRALLGISAVLGALLQAAPAPGASDITGRWMVEKRDAIILVEPRGETFVGHVVWAKDRDGIRGEERLDIKNPNPALRSRKVLGLAVLTGLSRTPRPDGWYVGGRIYNPKTGKRYPVKVRLDGAGRLRLRVGGSVMGQTTYWTRAN
jgi:uncharacterized protein (DUF2147 family)